LNDLLEEEIRQKRKIAVLESELDSKMLDITETDRIKKQEELRGLKNKLSLLQRDISMLQKEIDSFNKK
jgi:hypothetical protein